MKQEGIMNKIWIALFCFVIFSCVTTPNNNSFDEAFETGINEEGNILSNVLQIKQNNSFLEKQGEHNLYLIKNESFEIFLPYDESQIIYISASVADRNYSLPIDHRELFEWGGGYAESTNQEERDLFVSHYGDGFHYNDASRRSLDLETMKARIYFRSFVFTDTPISNRLSVIVYIDYNSDGIIEENEIMHLIFQFID